MPKSSKATKKKAGAEEGDAPQACLSLVTAARIVGSCLIHGPHGNDDTLEETGLITDPLREIFRECVFSGVSNEGCEIDRADIPNDADAEVGDVIVAVFDNSH